MAIKSHGLIKHPLYCTWSSMLTRCYNKRRKCAKNYSERGITVCKSWRTNFLSFYSWAISNGWEKGLSLERIKVNKGYSPSNCTFIPLGDQNKNKRNSRFFTMDGQRKTISDWAVHYNLTPQIVFSRINKSGWPIKKAITTPKRKVHNEGNKYKYNGQMLRIKEIAELNQTSYSTLKNIMSYHNINIYKALEILKKRIK